VSQQKIVRVTTSNYEIHEMVSRFLVGSRIVMRVRPLFSTLLLGKVGTDEGII